jgi:hypothetical protein
MMLTEMFLNETYNKICIDKLSSDTFPIQNCLMKRDAVSPLLFNFASECAITKIGEIKMDWNRIEHISSWFVLMMLIYWVET